MGYKYFSPAEFPDATHTLDIPSYLADTLRNLTGPDQVMNATDLLMHTGYGLRARCTPSEIASFEYSNGQAAEAVKRMLFALREGMTDHAVVESGRLNGDPLSCHITFGTSRKAHYGLCGPSGERIRRGQPLAFNVAYCSSNICRASWIAESAADLPEAASDYVPAFAGPLFRGPGGMVRIDETGYSGTGGLQFNPGPLTV